MEVSAVNETWAAHAQACEGQVSWCGEAARAHREGWGRALTPALHAEGVDARDSFGQVL